MFKNGKHEMSLRCILTNENETLTNEKMKDEINKSLIQTDKTPLVLIWGARRSDQSCPLLVTHINSPHCACVIQFLG